jgi:hypothetical protein
LFLSFPTRLRFPSPKQRGTMGLYTSVQFASSHILGCKAIPDTLSAVQHLGARVGLSFQHLSVSWHKRVTAFCAMLCKESRIRSTRQPNSVHSHNFDRPADSSGQLPLSHISFVSHCYKLWSQPEGYYRSFQLLELILALYHCVT